MGLMQAVIFNMNNECINLFKENEKNDRCTERNSCNCVKKPEKKKFRTSTEFEPLTSRYQHDALPTEL